MDRDELENRKREVERRYGAWISHNLQLQDDLYTIQRGVAGGNEARVRRVVQLVADLAHGPIRRQPDIGSVYASPPADDPHTCRSKDVVGRDRIDVVGDHRLAPKRNRTE